MAPNALPAGHAVLEYRVEKVLGVGGFGLTYLAVDANLNLKVALKEYLPGDIALRAPDNSIAPRSAENADSYGWGKQRFLDESRTLASFRHPNIVRVMRFFEANGTAYMVMEFVEGAALGDWIQTRRPLAEPQVAAIVGPLLAGLELVHKSGYLHRDIKPNNIYIREDDSPVLLDFGSARQRSTELTAIVTPGYAPFEQYQTQGNQGPWSDLYALAGVLYWMVVGKQPVDAVARLRKDELAPAVQAGDRSRFRPEFLAAIDWALAPYEDQRPQSVAEWREALLGTGAPEPKTERVERASAAPRTTTKTVPQRFSKEVFERAVYLLSEHLGPVARVVVKRAVAKARDERELYLLLGDEIEDPEERKLFVRTGVSITGKP
ncbi:MAG TPA: serine/threonine-protein kinase [Burkholderiales bacterium]|nr:serine/threonine-protein kinase [Burkholderiales bacterium]